MEVSFGLDTLKRNVKNFLVIIAKQERYYSVEPDIEAQMSSNENYST